MPFTPTSASYRAGRRCTDAEYCAEQTLALMAYNASPLRRGLQAPEAHQRPLARSPSLPWSARLPPWLRSFGVLFAVLCAAGLGIIPFLGAAVIAFLADEPSAPPAQPSVQTALPQPVVLQAPAAPPVLPASGGEAGSAAVLGALETLRRDLQAQELARQTSEVATGERVRRLEEAVAKTAASGAVAGPVVQVVSEGANEGGDATSGLGVDWAAWSAGAEIDYAHTSAGLGRGALGRAARAAAALLPRYRAYLGNVSHPPEVVLASESGPPSRCFAFGTNGSVAVRFPKPVRPLHVAVERRPDWATLQRRAAPRRFEVRAWSAAPDAEPYSASLGAFEYALDGPRAQVFALQGLDAVEGGVQAVQFVFLSNWGEDYTSVCRLRVLGKAPE